MGKVYIYLSYESWEDDKDKECGLGFFADESLVETFKEIAKENKLQLLIEKVFDYTEE